jgi:TetR/AcrR family transcriptional regulator, cholesterol catabolism regulator
MEFGKKLDCKAMELFMKYGIKSVSMDDLASALGVSKKTIYNEIENKEALISRLLERYIIDETEQIECIHRESKDAVHELVLIAQHVSHTLDQIQPITIFDLKKYFVSHWETLLQLVFAHIYQVIIQNVKWGREADLYRMNFDEDIMCRLYVANSMLLFDEFYFPSDKYNKKRVFQEFITQFLFSIISPEGEKVYLHYIKEINSQKL